MANNTQYADNIKKIVRKVANRRYRLTPKQREGIKARRGIGYMDAATNTAKSQSGSAGTGGTQLANANPADNKEVDKNKEGKETLNKNDITTGIILPSSGVEDAKDVVDGVTDNSKLSNILAKDDISKILDNSTLNGINAIDCDTGQSINIRLRGGFIPPDGWDDAETPPDDPDWEIGYYIKIQGSSFYAYGATINTAAVDGIDCKNDDAPNYAPWVLYSIVSTGAGTWNVTYKGWNRVLGTSATNVLPATKTSCSADPPPGYVTPDPCPLVAPVLTQWPADNTYSFKFENGQFKTSEYDGEVPLRYKDPVSKIDFCMGGGRTGSIEVTRLGGTMIYETSAGAPTGMVKVYDNKGNFISAFDTTSADWINSYRP